MEGARVRRTLSRGLRNAAAILWLLAKVMVPATLAVTFLDRTGWLPLLARAFAPAMGWFGLPGEAAIALVAGNLSSMYAGVGAMAALELGGKERLILAAMLMLSHSLPQEGAIVAQAGGKVAMVLGARLLTAAVSGLVLNILL
ncbi:MAG TPA: nucleoside recognition protein [Firmicutes bacterium]|nr:nucleoside recognition protein [Bacillota bacterium]